MPEPPSFRWTGVVRTTASPVPRFVRCTVAPALAPFARRFYAQTFEYQWWDDDGVRLPQAEGCEQGDPLVFLALFALGQQEALRPLRRADSQLRQGESLMAFLDGLYVLLPEPSRARAALDLVTREVETHAPTWARRVFSTTKVARRPAAMWLRRSGPPHIGRPEYVRAWGAARLETEDALLRQLPKLPDLQCAWLLLSFSAAHRANRLFLPTSSHHTLQHMMQLYGAPCRTRHAPLGGLPSSRPTWHCGLQRAPARRVTGRPGPMPDP